MYSIRLTFVLSSWLVVMTAGAAPLGNVGKGDSSDLGNSPPTAERSSETLKPSPAGPDQTIIMRRLRAIVEELRQQGPPPVGCMEG